MARAPATPAAFLAAELAPPGTPLSEGLPPPARPHGVEPRDIFAAHGPAYLASHAVTPEQERAIRDIAACRTAELGHAKYECEGCGEATYCYRSCRNRNCPKCQALRSAMWLEGRASELIDVGYYHIVLAVPHELGPLFLFNQEALYDLLLRTAWDVVATFAADPRHLGAQTGAIAVLHTWTQTLMFHPHAHLLVPSGGVTERGGWRRSGRKFFAPVRGMSKVFRARLVAGVRRLARAGQLDASGLGRPVEEVLGGLFDKPWAVYCKRPFSDAGNVLRYLARYTHRVAISNSRILSFEGGVVRFTWRDSREGRRTEKVTGLPADELVRRFLTHVLPRGFRKIRYYGILASRGKGRKLELARRPARTPPYAHAGLTEAELRDLVVEGMIGRKPGTCAKCGGNLIPTKMVDPPARE